MARADEVGATPGTVVGVVEGYEEATRAVNDLRAAGFRDDQIGVVGRGTSEPAASGLPVDPTHTRWEEGSGIGAAVGGATGLGLGLAVVAGLIPPVGPIIAGGTLLALLAGAGTAAGTVVGALIGLGVSEDDARRYEADLAAGRVVVTVQAAGDRAAVAREILSRHAPPAGTTIGVYGTGVPATPY